VNKGAEEIPMKLAKWISWAGLAAIFGGLIAIILTIPFATAYFSAYPGFDVPPFWLQTVTPVLRPLLSFATPKMVYNVYGRIFELVYLLFLPAVFGLHHLHHGARNRVERWGFGILVVGLLATFIGVAGDYWADGTGFVIELLGLLILSIGTTVYGLATLQSRVLPTWCAWLLIAGGPGSFVFQILIGHIPSGPTFPFALSWLFVGWILVFKKVGNKGLS
jgi:hypothetical protein